MRIQTIVLGLLLNVTPFTISSLIPRQSNDECVVYANDNANDKWDDLQQLQPNVGPSTNNLVEWSADDGFNHWSMELNNEANRQLHLANTILQGNQGGQYLIQITFYDRAAREYWLDSGKSCTTHVDFLTPSVQFVNVFRRIY